MIASAVIAGLAGFWLWTVLNDEDGIFGFLNGLLAKNHITKKWMECPWCSGAWFSIIGSFILFHPSVPAAIVVSLAASAVCGMLGSYFNGE